MVLSTASILRSCLHGMPMWTCRIVYHATRSMNTVQSMSPRVNQPIKEIFAKIVRILKDDNTSLKAVQKLLINSVEERDYSAQETCHLLLQLPMFKASWDFTVLSLDGSRAVQEQLDEGQPATALSILDHYIARPATPRFQRMKLLQLARPYTRIHPAGERMSWSLYVLTCLLNQTAPTMSSIVTTD